MHTVCSFEQEEEDEKRRIKEERESANIVGVDLITEEYLQQRTQPDPIGWEIEGSTGIRQITLSRDQTVQDLVC